MADVIDCAATVAAGDRIPQRGRAVSGTLAAASAVNGLLLLARVRRTDAA